MSSRRPEISSTRTLRTQWLLLRLAVGLLILKVTAAIVMNYGNYLPPNFHADFLRGRESYFFNGYHWAFWGHIVAGPFTLILGLILISNHFRIRYPVWHRRLGWMQTIFVLGLLVPSGLWMAQYAASGPVAGASLATLAILTGGSLGLGLRAALHRKFAEHRRWMLRNFTLLCSAVVLRLMAGAATTFHFTPDWFDPAATWACWLIPMTILESWLAFSRRKGFPDRALRHKPVRSCSPLPESERI